jgi:hypothetical protein
VIASHAAGAALPASGLPGSGPVKVLHQQNASRRRPRMSKLQLAYIPNVQTSSKSVRCEQQHVDTADNYRTGKSK